MEEAEELELEILLPKAKCDSEMIHPVLWKQRKQE
jgi:hypothetical protein